MWCVFSSRRRHTRCALVTGVQTCARPILFGRFGHWDEQLGLGRYLAKDFMPYPGWYVKSVSETRNPAVEVAARNGVKRCCRNQKRSVGEEMVILRRQCHSQLFVEFGAFYRTGLQHNSPLSLRSADRKSTRLNYST